MPPFFSVIIPTYNRAAVIEAALASVLEQTFSDYEVIVVDDGSTDNTVAVTTAAAARTDRSVRLLQQPNSGPGAARNAAIKNATGEYVALLDSDDLWFPWTLQNFHRAIEKNDRPEFLCGVPIDVKAGEPIHADGNQEMVVEQYSDFYSVPGNPFFRFTTSGVVIRKTSLQSFNGFAAERMNYEDLDLWMRLGTARIRIDHQSNASGSAISGRQHQRFPRTQSARANFMITSEKTGRYPGGNERRADRRRLLTVLMRAASVQMARSGDYRSASSLYFQIFLWSLMQLRLRYLLGLPVQILSGMIGKR